jgi:hypothetical protein
MAKLTPIEKQLKAVLLSHKKEALPASKNRWQRNGNGIPLVTWLHCANRMNGSAINAVLAGSARSRFTTFGASSMYLIDKIAKRYKITHAQYDELSSYVSARYRGRVGSQRAYMPEFIASPPDQNGSRMRVFDWFKNQLNAVTPIPPLRALIDPQVTDLILMYELQDAITHATTTRRQKWTQTN